MDLNLFAQPSKLQSLREIEKDLARTDGPMARALELAVKWDRLGVAAEILKKLGGMRQRFPDGAGSTVGRSGA